MSKLWCGVAGGESRRYGSLDVHGLLAHRAPGSNSQASQQILRWLTIAAMMILLLIPAGMPRADLLTYVRQPDPAFHWKYLQTRTTPRGKIDELAMVSQVWEGFRWRHQLWVYEPHNLRYPNTLLLFVTGGHASQQGENIGFALADHAAMRVAVLYEIPKQPLFGGRKEDALIAYTFTQYLDTGDGSWPLLFPMVQSVRKAMDAIQAFAPEAWGRPINKFIVSGASKRGWTTWLTAASGDPRVVAIAPMVIDTLDIPVQMKHQLACYGTYSGEIDDYVHAGLLDAMHTPAGRHLWKMVDPYTFRQSLTLPKLIINGTNDPYWAQDALNFYWKALRGGKWILYVPNGTHSLREDPRRVYNAVGAFARHIAAGQPMPQFTWKQENDGAQQLRLVIQAQDDPQGARLWTAHSATLDFRKSKWTSVPMRRRGTEFVGDCPRPQSGHVALFGEAEYKFEGQPYTLSTQIRIAGRPRAQR